MKSKEKELTNEGLTKLFNDNFDLAITAIKLAQNEVDAGHEVTMQKVLSEIKHNPMHFLHKKKEQHSQG